MGQIKQFASNVVPKPRFLFDNYKVQEDLYSETKAPETDSEVEMSDGETSESEITPALKSQQQQKHDDDYFSFFNSHENIILKPESSFKGLRSFLVNLPIDYYILLQEGYKEKSAMTADERFVRTNYIYMNQVPLLQ